LRLRFGVPLRISAGGEWILPAFPRKLNGVLGRLIRLPFAFDQLAWPPPDGKKYVPALAGVPHQGSDALPHDTNNILKYLYFLTRFQYFLVQTTDRQATNRRSTNASTDRASP
jgi:hypothetical protein